MVSLRPVLVTACLICIVPAAWIWADDAPSDEQRPSFDAAQCATLREFSDAPSPYGDAWHDYQCYERLGLRYSTEYAPREPDLDTYDDGLKYDVTQLQAGSPFDLTVAVTATNTNSCGYWTEDLRVWADWNQDGDFLDDGEMIVDEIGRRAYQGLNLWDYQVDVPDDAQTGEVWMRARVDWHYADGTVTSTGGRCYGEVEDYQLSATPELSPAALLLLPLVGPVLRTGRRRLGRCLKRLAR